MISDNKFWRFFAAITFLNQVVRVPLFLSIASDAKDLEVYFVISATSIPVQFIAQDILQYRSKTHGLSFVEKIGLPLFACGSIIYVGWHYGLEIAASYLIFAICLLLYGASVGHVRDYFPAKRVLAMDALYNTGTTLLGVASVFFIKNGVMLGYLIIFSQAIMALLISIFNMITIRHKYSSVASGNFLVCRSSNSSDTTPLVLASIMATTQLERLVIAASQPFVLICISLAAGVTQALRKISMDDAIVFERLRKYSGDALYQEMYAELRRARCVFYPILFLAVIAGALVDEVSRWLIRYGLFRSLDADHFASTLAILCIYLSVMPAAIVMINTLRLRVFPLSRFGWCALFIVLCIEVAVAAVPAFVSSHLSLAMFVIILTASLSYTLFLALCPVKLYESFKVLFPDVSLFLLIITTLAWLNFLW